MALRSFAQIGSSVATLGLARFGSVFAVSVLDFVHLGSSLSLRSFARCASGLSVLDFLHLGSSLSLRSFGRCGSALAAFGLVRFGSSLAVLDCVVPFAPILNRFDLFTSHTSV